MIRGTAAARLAAAGAGTHGRPCVGGQVMQRAAQHSKPERGAAVRLRGGDVEDPPREAGHSTGSGQGLRELLQEGYAAPRRSC